MFENRSKLIKIIVSRFENVGNGFIRSVIAEGINAFPTINDKEIDLYMKATGIVRRVDDLGRVVIPKEIRRTMRIREGGLGCRLGRCFYFVEVSTGHPHPVGNTY